jgi:HK97 family phage prohead protease
MTLHLYWPLRKIDHDRREVYGYASTEAEDSQGEIVARAALEAALPAYMRFANIREMHQPSAVGIAREAAVDDKGLYVKAQIVDAEAWVKVKEGVYKGFSIGGAVTERDAHDPRIITGVELTEISLVDRPANPEAIFAVWKSRDGKERTDMSVLTQEVLRTARARLAQRWVASDGSAFEKAEAAARHEAGLAKDATFVPAAAPTAGLTNYALEGAGDGKGDAAADFADPGFHDGKKRYPIDSARHIRAAWSYIHQKRNQAPYSKDELDHIKARIIAAWKAKIDRDGPPAARGKALSGGDLGKGLQEVARLALLIQELEWLRFVVAESEDEDGDASTVPADFQAAVAQIAAVLRAMVDAETACLLAGDDDEDDQDFAAALKHAAAALPLGAAAALRPLVRGARLAKADATVLARVGQLGDLLAKDGAALGTVEQAFVQDIHDHAVSLGAGCSGAGVTKRAGALDELAAALPLIREVKELVEKVAAQPAVMPPSRLVAIDKGSDVTRELDRIAAQPPAVTAFELIKRAIREPLPFNAPLDK